MNTPAIAQNLAARGRGEDKMLVHMTPSEVQGLQALAMAKGGSLTINPETGLPEAGFLSDTFKAFLPTIAGVGLSFVPGMQPWAAGLLVGGVEALRTKDLGRGLLAGLGAYGGAGMGTSLQNMGAEQATAAAANQAPIDIVEKTVAPTPKYFDPSATLGENLTTQSLKQPVTGFSGMQFSGGPGATPFGGVNQPTLQQLATQRGLQDQLTTTISPSVVPMDRAPSAFSKAGYGLDALGQEGGLKQFGSEYLNVMGKKGALASGLGTIGGMAYRAGAFDQPEMAMVEEEDYNYEGPYLPAERNVRFRGRDAILGGSGEEFRYFDPVNPYPNVRTAADGGYMMAGGRYLQGGGDGTSDSIPAVIGNDQPARLADGEFVLDARTVSEIGNGSSDAGARKLYALMDNVHKARQSADRGKPSGADQLLKGLTATA
jgi:hypothetical protein